MNIKKGDIVQVISGKELRKKGKVLSLDLKKMRVLVEGLNLYKKNVRPKREGEKGQVVELPRSVSYSNVLLYCSHCEKGVRFGTKVEKEGKSRYCKKCKISL
ncbi:MAG: 50S ribosomal protein L24 [Candidatus Pacebacteria bacterium]|nr:50S ribosomal protein L24 [Candidatus Paceibacterota bacterium]